MKYCLYNEYVFQVQKYNSKFQEFETVLILKMQKTTKFEPRKFPRIYDYEKPTKKEERKKKKATFQNQPHKKGQKKKKEGRGFGRLPSSFFFPPFLLVSYNRKSWETFLVQIWSFFAF